MRNLPCVPAGVAPDVRRIDRAHGQLDVLVPRGRADRVPHGLGHLPRLARRVDEQVVLLAGGVEPDLEERLAARRGRVAEARAKPVLRDQRAVARLGHARAAPTRGSSCVKCEGASWGVAGEPSSGFASMIGAAGKSSHESHGRLRALQSVGARLSRASPAAPRRTNRCRRRPEGLCCCRTSRARRARTCARYSRRRLRRRHRRAGRASRASARPWNAPRPA